MPKKPLHDKLLRHSVHMLELYNKQLALTKQMMYGYECRIATMEEFIRANFTGDSEAFKILAPIVGKGTGTKRPFYNDGFLDVKRTKTVVQQAHQWSAAHEQKDQSDPVPSLPEGDVSDAPREAPTAQLSAGAPLPDVESEGGNID